jgi:hypothetical protein
MEPGEDEPLIHKKNDCYKKNSITLILFIIIYLTGFIIILLYCIINNKSEITTMYDNEKWVYIIRQRDIKKLLNIDANHALCTLSYFQKFPLGKPKLALSSLSPTTIDEIYMLVIMTDAFNISLFRQLKANETHEFSEFVLGNLNEYDRIIIAYEHEYIPSLLQYLGCKNCEDGIISDHIVYALKYYNVTKLELLRIYTDNFINNKCVENNTYKYSEFHY